MKSGFWLYLGLTLIVSLSTYVACDSQSSQKGEIIRIGWQIPWATQGQVVQVMKHTNVLQMKEMVADFVGFSYGGPLNEAALAGDVDVIFTADQPAAMLLARDGKWTIVGRLMYNRVATYVPPDSPVKSMSDLKGKRVAMPFGAAAQRVALKAMIDAGLNPVSDIESIHLDILEQNSIVQSGNRDSWGNIDALVGFDPTPAIFEQEGLARMLHVGSVVSLVLISTDYLMQQPQASQRFLEAFIESWYFYSTHQDIANRWFQDDSRLNFDPVILDIAASVEPNIAAQSIIDIQPYLSENDVTILQEAADFVYDQGLASTLVTMSDYIDQSHMIAAFDVVKQDWSQRIRIDR